MNALTRVVIFGATSAIAEQVARGLAEDGTELFCIARDPQKLAALLQDLRLRAPRKDQLIDGTTGDLGNRAIYGDLWEEAMRTLGPVDGVLVAHGMLPNQDACEADLEVLLQSLEINALSVVGLLTPIANYLEEQGRGVIAVISSVAGDRGRQSNYAYGAAKGMVTLFLQGLRNRLYPAGVSVVTIKPGFVTTPMTAEFDRSGPLWATPQAVAAGILKAMKKGSGEVYLPSFWRWIMFIVRHLPEVLFKRLKL